MYFSPPPVHRFLKLLRNWGPPTVSLQNKWNGLIFFSAVFYVLQNHIKMSYWDKQLFFHEWLKSNKITSTKGPRNRQSVRPTAKQTDQQTDRQVVGQRCRGSEGEGPTWALLACPHPLLASPLLNAREQMGCTARLSVHQSYCTKQHTPQATTPTSVSRTEPYQTWTPPPTPPTNTQTQTHTIIAGNFYPIYSIVRQQQTYQPAHCKIKSESRWINMLCCS